MKIILATLLFFILLQPCASAQTFESLDLTVMNYPHSFSSPEKLARRINEDFHGEVERSRAIFTWIASNISYDIKAYFAGSKAYSFNYSTLEEKAAKELEHQHKLARNTIKKGKGVCEGYAALFSTLCELSGVECEIISGSSKNTPQDIGKAPSGRGHAWNAIKINGIWQLVDVTWAAGIVDLSSRTFEARYNDFYFMTPPELFFLKHFPENTAWLLIDKNAEDFSRLPLYYSRALTEDFSIIQPKNGIIKSKAGKNIKFVIQGSLDAEKLTYAYQRDKFSSRMEITSKGTSYSFSILSPDRKTDFLTLFYEGKGLLTFKIENR